MTLIFGMQIANQYLTKTEDLSNTHQAFLEFVGEFEVLYYQC